MLLDKDQEYAVKYPGHLVCVAGPGSGKTRTITNKAVYLLQNNPDAIVGAVTYTKNAAKEIYSRIIETFPEAATRVKCGTFHSMCGRQLRDAGIRYRLAKEGELFYYVRAIMEELNIDDNIDDVISKITILKSSNITPKLGDMNYDLLTMYEKSLQKHNVYDFSDLIIKSTQGMKNNKIRALPIDFLLVDEYQDSDVIQYEWIKTQSKLGCTTVTVVGDDDQSIYAWRSAIGYEAIKKFKADFNSGEVLLSTNYRCGKNIIQHASNLISYNQDRVPKEIKAFEKNPEGEVSYIIVPDRYAESEICARIVKDNSAEGKSWAILARTNRLLDDVELMFNASNIPVVRVGGEGYWEQDGSQMILELCATIYENKWNGLSHFLDKFGCTPEQIDGLQAHFSKTRCTNWVFGKRGKGIPEEINQLFAGQSIQEKETLKLISLIREWAVLEKEKFTDLVLLGISTWVADHMVKKYKLNCTSAANSLIKLKGTLKSRVLFISGLSNSKEVGEDVVSLITLHSSKGMEFNNVIMLAFEQGNCPSLKNSNLEEERRLAYVGFTRAKEKLFITRTTEMPESIFVAEAGLTAKLY